MLHASQKNPNVLTKASRLFLELLLLPPPLSPKEL